MMMRGAEDDDSLMVRGLKKVMMMFDSEGAEGDGDDDDV